MRALGEHMSLGRLGVDEYGDRSARAAAARTRGELDQLFTDLPEPHRIPVSAAGEPLPVEARDARPDVRRAARPRRADAQNPAQRLGVLVPLSGLLALVLFFTIDELNWLIFLLPAAVALLISAVASNGGKRSRGR